MTYDMWLWGRHLDGQEAAEALEEAVDRLAGDMRLTADPDNPDMWSDATGARWTFDQLAALLDEPPEV